MYRCRRRWMFFVLLCACLLLAYKFREQKTYSVTDEHLIYTSLLIELPHLESAIRAKQANLSRVQNQLARVEKHLSKYTWHLTRLINTIDSQHAQAKRLSRSTSFDWDVDRDRSDNATRFLLYFHPMCDTDGTDQQLCNEFHSKIATVRSPHITSNRSEASLRVIYLPIRSKSRPICYRDVIDRNDFVLYERIDSPADEIDERCFDGNFLQVTFFARFKTNATWVNNDRWRVQDDRRIPVAVVYLRTNGELVRLLIQR